MTKHLTFVVAALALAAPSRAAEHADPRLATVTKAFVEAVDLLADDDKATAACFAEHVALTTPVEAVTLKTDADVILRVGSTKKKATIAAALPDGTKIWAGETNLKDGFGWVMIHRDGCGLADKLINELRQAMRKARAQ